MLSFWTELLRSKQQTVKIQFFKHTLKHEVVFQDSSTSEHLSLISGLDPEHYAVCNKSLPESN